MAAMRWPEGIDQVRWRSKVRCASAVGPSWLGIAASGKRNSGEEILVSISLLGRTSLV